MYPNDMRGHTLATNCDNIYFNIVPMIVICSYVCNGSHSIEFYICIIICKSDYNMDPHWDVCFKTSYMDRLSNYLFNPIDFI